MTEVSIDPEFKALIPPLAEEERRQLEENLKQDGCRDPLVTWQGWLLDGHNRYEICTRLGIEYGVTELGLPDKVAALDWMDANQLGRRNLSPEQMSLLRGRIYNRSKGRRGGDRRSEESKGKSFPLKSTAQDLAEKHGVTDRTIKNDGKFAESVEQLEQGIPGYSERVMTGEVKRKQVAETAEALNEIPEEAREEVVAKGEAEILARAKEIRSQRAMERRAKNDELASKAVPTMEGQYDVIVIDPPWPMEKIARDVRPNQVHFDYPTMSEEQIKEIDLPAADDCHVFIWTTHKFLPMALRCAEHWGFRYVCTFVWHKPGGFQPIGLPQYNSEFALYCRKGSPKFVDTKAFKTCFQAPRGAHSEKPEDFYDVLRRVTSGKRLDVFNRREINGFEGWGNESANVA